MKIIDDDDDEDDKDQAKVPVANGTGEANGVPATTNGNATKPVKYIVQLIDENSEGLEDFTKTVTRDEIKQVLMISQYWICIYS